MTECSSLIEALSHNVGNGFPSYKLVPVNLPFPVYMYLQYGMYSHAHKYMWAYSYYRSVPQMRPPFVTLASVQNEGLYAGCDDFSRDYALPTGTGKRNFI